MDRDRLPGDLFVPKGPVVLRVRWIKPCKVNLGTHQGPIDITGLDVDFIRRIALIKVSSVSSTEKFTEGVVLLFSKLVK